MAKVRRRPLFKSELFEEQSKALSAGEPRKLDKPELSSFSAYQQLSEPSSWPSLGPAKQTSFELFVQESWCLRVPSHRTPCQTRYYLDRVQVPSEDATATAAKSARRRSFQVETFVPASPSARSLTVRYLSETYRRVQCIHAYSAKCSCGARRRRRVWLPQNQRSTVRLRGPSRPSPTKVSVPGVSRMKFAHHRGPWPLVLPLLIYITALKLPTTHSQSLGCQFHPVGENRRFERVAENLPVGHEVFRVEVHPRNEFKLEAVDNSLSDSNYFKYEAIDEKTVAIKLAQSLEDLVDRRDPQSVLKFKLTCKGASGTEDAYLPVTVYVNDVNDHPPVFQNVPYHLEVDELTPVGLTVFRGIHAADRDKPNTANADVTYSIVGGNENNSFILSDPIEGILVVNKPLDYDNGIREFKIQIQASDHGTPISLSQVTTMSIRVKDADDQNPVFTTEAYKASVSETAKATGQSIREKVTVQPAIHAFDLDSGINARLRYSIISGNDAGFFEIHEQTGELFLVREIDLESLPNAGLTLQIQATQVDNSLRQASARIDVFIQDINDNFPEFEYDMYNITVMENLPPGFTVLQVYATDADKGANAEFKYILDDPSGAFRIDEKTGWISVMDPTRLDRESTQRIQMRVTAVELKPNVDPSRGKKSSSATTVEINLLDANDNTPAFFPTNLYTFSVLETAPAATIVGSVFAHDNDLGENGMVVYYKQNDTFSQNVPLDVHLHNGSVYVLDSYAHMHKKSEQYTFFVVASDLARIHFERRTGVAVVRINVTDINNSVPEFVGTPYEAYVGESLPEGAYVTQIQARDADSSSGALEFSIIAGNDEKLFIIDSKHGKIFTAAVLDYEKKQSYDLLVQVSDGINTAVAPILVNVVDINDQIPTFAHNFYNFSVIEELNPNVTVGTVIAIDRDSGKNAQIRYNIVGDHANDAFYIDSVSGVIRTRRRLDREIEEALDFTVIAFDGGTPQLSGTTFVRVKIVDINDNSPTFEQETYTVEIPEEVSPPFDVFQVKSADLDTGDNSVTKYVIITGNSDKTFALNADTGQITTAERLNFERKSEYVLHIAARNTRPFQGPSADSILSPAVQVVIQIRDVNDEMVIFDQQSYRFQVHENTPVNSVVGALNASNPRRESTEQDIVYWLDSNDGSTRSAQGKFEINSHTGQIVLRDTLDRDPPTNELTFKLRVYARVRNSINTFNTSVPVIIDILDINDNSPIFEENDFVVQLKENIATGTTVAKLRATDIDNLDKNALHYHIVAGNEEEVFGIEETTGDITVKIVPDREKAPAYMLRVVAVDSANNTGWTNIHVVIADENDWAPTFLNETFVMNVTEGPTSIGTRIRLPVVDYDDGINRQMEVYILDGNSNGEFRLDVDEGGPLLSIIHELDRDRYNTSDAALHFVTVIAKDKGSPPRIGKAMVAVIINDINDTPPKFEKDFYYEFVKEEAPVGMVIADLKATDADSPANTNLVYSFAKNTGKVPFTIDPSTGTVNVSRALDISESEQWALSVEVVDGLWKATTTLKVFVSEAEERDPRFDQVHYRFAIPENKAGVLVGRVELKPRKLRVNALMRYNIVNTEMRTLFNISAEGEIYTRRGLDREKKSQYVFTVMLEEKRPSTKITVSEVIVDVLDLNDEVPTFHTNYRGSIKENSPPGTPVNIGPPTIKAVDNDAGNNSVIHYFLGGEGSDRFTILDSGTVIFTPTDPSQSLDREQRAKYRLSVSAIDRGNLSSTTSLSIDIEDENDNAPQFEHGPLFVLLPEIAKAGSKVVQVKATDADEKGPNSKIQYYITAGGKGELRMDKQTGEVFVVGTLKPGTVYFLNISAVDGAGLAAKSSVNVTVVDLNDHKPTFESQVYSFEVLEGNYTNQKVKLGLLQARDEDIGRNGLIEYTILNSFANDFPFSLDAHTGELFARGFIDREARETYAFEVTALDYGEPPQNTSCEVTIKVKDTNDEKPRFYTDPYLAHVPENLDPGHKVTQIAAFDPDLGENGQVFYRLGEGHENKFYIDGKDGTVWTLSTLDYEEQSFYNITIIAYDKGKPSLSSVAKLWVTVADTNDAVPDFAKAVYTLEVAENAKPGDTVFTLNAGEGPFKYSLTNTDSVDTFSVEESNGRVKLAQPLDSVQRNHYRLLVKAADDSDPPKFDTAEVNIIIGTGQGVRLFPQRFYEVTVSENQLAPLLLIDLNSTDEITHRTPHYSIVGSDFKGLFKVEPETGRLNVMRSLDRENKNLYHIKVKAENLAHPSHRIGKRDTRPRPASSTTSLDSKNHHLAFDEALVIVTVGDENDNVPQFDNKGKPVVAAVPLEASFGYQVVKLSAKDVDVGINGAIRYEILSRSDDASSKFHIDPTTGVVRSMVTFSLDGGKLFGFDVKATDREGSESGNSAVTNVFVYVLPETRMVLFVAHTEPIVVEKRSKEILGYLSNVTGFDVKMAKLEPHREGELQEVHSTDLFLYAVNPDTNDIVDTDTLLDVFRQNSHLIVENLEQFRIKRIQGVTVQEKVSQMGATEIAILALSSIIFLGTVLAIALLCSSCKERKLRKRQTSWEQQRLYNIKNPLMGKGTVANPYGSRGIPNGHSSSTYSTGDGAGSEYLDSLGSYKRNNGGAVPASGPRVGGGGVLNKSRQQVPPDGASSLNPPRSPRFSDRYRHVAGQSASQAAGPTAGGASGAGGSNGEPANNDWFNKDAAESVVSGYSRASGRSARSGYSGTSWSSRKSRESPTATEL